MVTILGRHNLEEEYSLSLLNKEEQELVEKHKLELHHKEPFLWVLDQTEEETQDNLFVLLDKLLKELIIIKHQINKLDLPELVEFKV